MQASRQKNLNPGLVEKYSPCLTPIMHPVLPFPISYILFVGEILLYPLQFIYSVLYELTVNTQNNHCFQILKVLFRLDIL